MTLFRTPLLAVLIAMTAAVWMSRAAAGQTSRLTQIVQVAPRAAAFTGRADIRLDLFVNRTGGQPVSPTVDLLNVPVVNGLALVSFTVPTDVFEAQPRFLRVRVRTPAGQGAYLVLPRQPLLSVATARSGLISQTDGPEGPAGTQGPAGPQGPEGPAGPAGTVVGPVGATGPAGPIGPAGPAGTTVGPMGAVGLQGPQGAQGLVGAVGPQGPAGPTGAQGPMGRRLSPVNVATRRWFPVNQTGLTDVGLGGIGASSIVYDGQFMWVGTAISPRLIRINPATGASTTSTPTGTTGINSLLYAGDRLWLFTATTMVPYNTRTSTAGSAITLPETPASSVMDGTHIWLALQSSGLVHKRDAVTGALVAQYTFSAPSGVAFDGTSIWVSENGNNRVLRVNPSNGNVIATVAVGIGPGPATFDGENLWVPNRSGNSVSVVSTISTTLIQTIALRSAPQKAIFDGEYVWLIYPNDANFQLQVFNARTRVAVADSTAGTIPLDGAFDGLNTWFVSPLGTSAARR